MIIVRGIKGNLKLNPAIKLLGGITLFVVGLIWATFQSITDYRADVLACQHRGGIWIGGMPMRVTALRFLRGRCELSPNEEAW